MQPLSGNKCPDLLTSLRNVSLAPRLPRKMHLCRSVPHAHETATKPSCFVHFWQDALFRPLNFQRWSGHGVLCTFSVQNVLRATTACTFSTSQLPKALRRWSVLCILASKSASRHNGVQFLISHLSRCLRARRFGKPTFRPSGAPEHWKNTLLRDFSTFSRTCSFFLLTPSLLWPSSFFSCLPWLFPPPLFHLSIVSEVCFLNFLRTVPDSEMRSQWT